MKHITPDLHPDRAPRQAARRFADLTDADLEVVILLYEGLTARLDPAESLVSAKLHAAYTETLLAARAELERRKAADHA